MPTVKRSMTPFEWWWAVLAFVIWILFIARSAGG